MMARSTLNSIERKISKALIYNELSREDFTNEENIYRELKESIGMMKSQRRDIEKISLFVESKKKQALVKSLTAMKLLITV